MPFIIALEDELGMEHGTIEDEFCLDGIIDQIHDKNFICIRFIDKEGVTVFNRLQMLNLMSELSLIRNKFPDSETLALVEKILVLAQRCKSEGDKLLYFYGN